MSATRLSVGVQVFGTTSVVLLIAFAISSLSIIGLGRTVGEFQSIERDDRQTRQVAYEATLAVNAAAERINEIGAGRFDDSSSRQTSLENAFRQLQNRTTDPTAQRSLLSAFDAVTRYNTAINQMEAVARAGDTANARSLGLTQANPTILDMHGAIGDFLDRAATIDDDRRNAVAAQAEGTRGTLIVVLVAGVIVGLVLSGMTTRSLVTRLRTYLGLVSRVGRGDLTGTVRVAGADELTLLGHSLNTMVDSLHELTGQIRESVTAMSSSSAEILAATSQHASSATEQSAAISETSATIEEVKASAEQAADRAEIVSEATRQVSHAVQEGVDAVHHASVGMADIQARVQSIAENILVLSEQSQQIGEIIATVNELSDQSNLLALNAAIEASRAGEHGKGFAVVAAEIRNLAEQSRSATAQVRVILSDIQRATNAAVMAMEEGNKGVEVGMRLVDDAGRTIESLAEAVDPAAQAAMQITIAVRQHTVGMEQIAAAMSHISQATSQNMSAASDTQQAVQSLDGLAGRLTRLVAQYQV
jgi:methyl-accepting chemotaxis protein